jgi:predicted transcriptional regulator
MSIRGKHYDRRRQRLKVTKKELAELAGIDESCLGRFLNGRTEILTSTLTKLEDALAQIMRQRAPAKSARSRRASGNKTQGGQHGAL